MSPAPETLNQLPAAVSVGTGIRRDAPLVVLIARGEARVSCPYPLLRSQSLGMPAVLPPPEEEKEVKTAIGAARAKQARREML